MAAAVWRRENDNRKWISAPTFTREHTVMEFGWYVLFADLTAEASSRAGSLATSSVQHSVVQQHLSTKDDGDRVF